MTEKIKTYALKLNSNGVALVVLVVWVLSAIGSFVFNWFGRDTTEILRIVASANAIVLSAYLGKSGLENINKIIQSDMFGNPKNP